MRWTPGGRSEDIEDDRDSSGGGGGFNLGGMHIGIGGFLILLVLSLVFKRDFLSLVSGGGVGNPVQSSQPDTARDQREEPLVQFVSFVLDDTQKTWTQILSSENIPYRHAKLVLFRDSIDSACGVIRTVKGAGGRLSHGVVSEGLFQWRHESLQHLCPVRPEAPWHYQRVPLVQNYGDYPLAQPMLSWVTSRSSLRPRS